MIRIDEKYGVVVKERNYTLCKIGRSKDGGIIANPIGYYTSMDRALSGYIQKADYDLFRNMEDCDLKDAMEAFKEHREKIESILGPLFSTDVSGYKEDGNEPEIAEEDNDEEDGGEEE